MGCAGEAFGGEGSRFINKNVWKWGRMADICHFKKNFLSSFSLGGKISFPKTVVGDHFPGVIIIYGGKFKFFPNLSFRAILPERSIHPNITNMPLAGFKSPFHA